MYRLRRDPRAGGIDLYTRGDLARLLEGLAVLTADLPASEQRGALKLLTALCKVLGLVLETTKGVDDE